VRKIKKDPGKRLRLFGKFGNTFTVSIPLTWVSVIAKETTSIKRLMPSGFGVGISWALAVLSPAECHVSTLVDVG
jgi:3-oxoacyl-[acyl-carrier-protein] synthase-3